MAIPLATSHTYPRLHKGINVMLVENPPGTFTWIYGLSSYLRQIFNQLNKFIDQQMMFHVKAWVSAGKQYGSHHGQAQSPKASTNNSPVITFGNYIMLPTCSNDVKSC